MRCILEVSIPVEKGNEAMKSGKLQKTLKRFIDEMKPEAAYFFAVGEGHRGGIMVLDLKEPSQIPMVAEPFFLGLNAKVRIQPAMTIEDLMKAGPHIEKAIKNS